LLLENDADPESEGNSCFGTQLSWATGNGHEAVVEPVPENGADPGSREQIYTSCASSNGLLGTAEPRIDREDGTNTVLLILEKEVEQATRDRPPLAFVSNRFESEERMAEKSRC
jgi:hypothetical protein